MTFCANMDFGWYLCNGCQALSEKFSLFNTPPPETLEWKVTNKSENMHLCDTCQKAEEQEEFSTRKVHDKLKSLEEMSDDEVRVELKRLGIDTAPAWERLKAVLMDKGLIDSGT